MYAQIEGRTRPKLFLPLALERGQDIGRVAAPTLSTQQLRRIVGEMLG